MAAGAGGFWFEVGSFVLVGMLWGCSSAVLKQSTAGGVGGAKRTRRQATRGAVQQEEARGKGLWAGLRALLGTKVRRESPT